ncbi:D-alanine--D-alanine ligase, C-terminal [Dillenia turbinata]|uniref:D-alanine--D-alanine ligase, C-terminal n=1 Tax=Dillenia turbinata TaxID=194707 RepID=A0AAN8WCY5_9MAGN
MVVLEKMVEFRHCRKYTTFLLLESNECRQAFDKVNTYVWPAFRDIGLLNIFMENITSDHLKSGSLFKFIPLLVKEKILSSFLCNRLDYFGFREVEQMSRFIKHQLDINSGKAVVKPARAGSSIGVTVAYGVLDAPKTANDIITEGIDDKVLVEIFLEGGREFTAIILDVGSGLKCRPAALLPTEVELQFHGGANVGEAVTILNYRRKYLPTQQVAYHTPPGLIDVIRNRASLLFQRLGLGDFARIDGWFLPSSVSVFLSSENKYGRNKWGTIIFTDINLWNGADKLFIPAGFKALVVASFATVVLLKVKTMMFHVWVSFPQSNVLWSIIQRACSHFPSLASFNGLPSTTSTRSKSEQDTKALIKEEGAHKGFVAFGGETSERLVSLMSGTNVWLKLQAFADVEVTPYLLASPVGDLSDEDEILVEFPMSSKTVWTLLIFIILYSLLLRHATEEVLDECIEAVEPSRPATTSY